MKRLEFSKGFLGLRISNILNAFFTDQKTLSGTAFHVQSSRFNFNKLIFTYKEIISNYNVTRYLEYD